MRNPDSRPHLAFLRASYDLSGWALGVWTLLIVSGVPSEAGAQDGRYQGPIIDMHLHAQASIWSERQLCFPRPCEGGGPTLAKSADELKPMTDAAMARNDVVLGVISGALEAVLPWTEGEEGRLRTGVVRPSRVPLDSLRALLASGRVQVVGEMNEQYFGIAVDDPALDPVFTLAHEFDVPVHIHLGGLGGTSDFPSHLGNPLSLVPVMRKYPGLRVYLENAAWPFLEEVTALMYQYPSVYVDVSTILHLTPRPVALKHVRGLVENGLGKRIMSGSDQMIWPEVIDVAIEAIQSAGFLTVDQKADILYNNAARFLRLSEDVVAEHQRGYRR